VSETRAVTTDPERPPASFIVPFWAAVFRALSFVSVFWLLRRIPWLRDEKRSYAVVEVWVFGHTALAFAIALFAYVQPSLGAVSAALIYGGLRVFELVVYQANVLLFDDWRARRAGKSYSLRGYRRILLLLLHNYAELIFWFMAALFAFHARTYLALDDASFTSVLRTTLLSMVTFSSDGIRIAEWRGLLLLTIQSVVGVFMTVMILARVLSLIPTPATQEPTEL
jgi:hypothetical protein